MMWNRGGETDVQYNVIMTCCSLCWAIGNRGKTLYLAAIFGWNPLVIETSSSALISGFGFLMCLQPNIKEGEKNPVQQPYIGILIIRKIVHWKVFTAEEHNGYL